MLPALAAEGLVDAVDVFCERIAFTLAETEQVFQAAQKLGIPVKLHAEQLSDMGGAALAARYGALSCDHIEHLSADGIAAMKAAGTVAVLLPGAYYTLRDTHLPPIAGAARCGRAHGGIDRPQPGYLARAQPAAHGQHGLHAVPPDGARGLAGITTHAARALGLQDSHGLIASGRPANFVLWPRGRCGRAGLLVRPPARLHHRAARAHSRSPAMNQLFAADALLPTGWARNVLIEWDGQGASLRLPPAPQPRGRADCRRPG